MPHVMNHCARLFAIALTVACDGGSGGAPVDETTGPMPLPPCERHVQGTGEEFWACDLPSPCSEAVLSVPMSGEASFVDRAAAECVARAFRDREPVRLQLGRSLMADGSKYETIFVLNEVDAVSNVLFVNTVNERLLTDRQLLRPRDYFEGCLAETSDQAFYECLDEWSMGCGDQPVACP
jgi:hypothetical protein